jgi:8-oxo-dGTP diphosphatase
MTARKITHVSAGILIRDDGQYLLGSRPEGKPYAGWWEFPGGKIEAGETPEAALVRELHEEMGITVTAATPWIVRRFVYEHAEVELHFFRVTGWVGKPQSREGQAFAWNPPHTPAVSPILPANAPILRGLQLPAVLALSNVAEMGESAWLTAVSHWLAQPVTPVDAPTGRWLVLREPQLDRAALARLAREVLPRVRAAGGKLILHGDVALAAELGADGVHLRAAQLDEITERPKGWCGASVHSAAELSLAARLGVDYAVLGPVAPTRSHPDATPLGWTGFARLLTVGWPFAVYGIGGLSMQDLADARQHGGQGVAMLRGAWT